MGTPQHTHPTPEVIATGIRDPFWRDHATCATETNPDRWVDLPSISYTGTSNVTYASRKRALAATCRECPAALDCLLYALANDVRGVFAGTDEYDRAQLRDRLNLPAPAPLPGTPPHEARQQVFRLLATGMTPAEVAHDLDLHPMTVHRIIHD